MREIIPSILVKTESEFVERVRKLEGSFEHAHIDIADGIFVPNTTIAGHEEVEGTDTKMRFSIHLMVSKPENHIARWVQVPSGIESIIFHTEATKRQVEVIDAIREGECGVGIALNPKTPWKEVEQWVELVDFVHFMTVEPGFNGGKFLKEVIEKITDFHYYYPDKPIRVDGGITPENIEELEKAGAGEFVVGSAIDKFI